MRSRNLISTSSPKRDQLDDNVRFHQGAKNLLTILKFILVEVVSRERDVISKQGISLKLHKFK